MSDDNNEVDRTKYMYAVSTLVLASCGGVLNLTCIIALLNIKDSLRTQLKLLLSLAVSDCLLDILQICEATVQLTANHVFTDDTNLGHVFSLVTGLSRLLARWTCLLTLLSLAVDLFLRVKKPLHYSQLMSRRRGNILISCIWTLPILLCLVLTVLFIIQRYSFWLHTAIQFTIQHFAVMLSFIVFCVLYSCIVCHVRTLSMNQSRAVRRTTVTSILIVGSYVICFLPRSFQQVVYTNEAIDLTVFRFLLFLQGLFIVNTIIDPLIYVTRVPEVKDRLKSAVQYVQRLRTCMVTGCVDTDNTNVTVTRPEQIQPDEHMALT